MADTVSIDAPAGFAPLGAIGWALIDGYCTPVSHSAPLPVRTERAAAAPVLEGTANAAALAGPFAAAPGRIVYLQLSGTWTGTVRVLRSVDGGASRHALTLGGQEWACFTANCCEAIWDEGEEGASLWLDLGITSGQLTYRVSQ